MKRKLTLGVEKMKEGQIGNNNPHFSRIIVMHGPQVKDAKKSKGRRKAGWM